MGEAPRFSQGGALKPPRQDVKQLCSWKCYVKTGTKQRSVPRQRVYVTWLKMTKRERPTGSEVNPLKWGSRSVPGLLEGRVGSLWVVVGCVEFLSCWEGSSVGF